MRCKSGIIKLCPCGNEVYIKPCLLNRKKYCSKKCQLRFHSHPSGLKYNIKTVNKGWFKYVNGMGYRHLMINENSICEWCKSNEDLEVDHIDKVRTNNNVTNLRILCNKCHIKRHLKTTWDIAGNNACLTCGRDTIKPSKIGMCHTCYERERRLLSI